MTFARELDDLGSSTQRLLHTVSTLGEEDWRAPSLLPDWTRAHVVAHLALNAAGFAGALEGVIRGVPTPVYSSQRDRDRDIEELVSRPRSVARERLEHDSARLATALSSLSAEQREVEVERIPGGPRWPVHGVARTRRREVEIHHADLGVGYRPDDWPDDFCIDLIDDLVADRAEAGPFVMVADESNRSWTVGAETAGTKTAGTKTAGAGSAGPEVHGHAAELGWWLSGRGDGSALRVTSGRLPDLGRWR